MAARPYDHLATAIRQRIAPTASVDERMRIVVDVLWEGLQDTGVSWVGFYLKQDNRDEMILGPRRDKPACSPIGLHGACGQTFQSATPMVVRDVRDLGDNYVACDPRDQSEIVLPCYDSDELIGVLDLDSFDLASFDASDISGLTTVLLAARLYKSH